MKVAPISCACLLLPFVALIAGAENEPPQSTALAAYFEQQVSAIEGQLEREVTTREDWLAKKDEYRRQLEEMLGLDLKAPRTDLKATKTGEFEQDGIMVEKIHFQSKPGLYVTGNLYRPKVVEKPLPTILYVCGHSTMVKDGVSYGNKAGYEHHGVWYAKHGFVCLVIDTVELGEIRGEHHGTYSKGRMWWMSRGYTPAGVEAWAGIRALDYLETRPEVDKSKFGITGRSGGGAYSWYIAALDERIACAVPTAGITTLRNHVVDGCIEGHCDCMFMVNTYRWDFDKLAALVAPRPLCIANTDKDSIFPVDGVFKIYQSTRRIYKLLDAEKNIGLQIAEGPHKDTQPLNTGEFHWMTRFLQGADLMATLDAPAVKSIPMEKLRVLEELPKEERNTTIDESFVAKAAEAKVPENAEQWQGMRDGWMKALREKCFSPWFPQPSSAVISLPRSSADLDSSQGGLVASLWIAGVRGMEVPLYLVHRADLKPKDLELVVLNVLDENGWQEFANTYAHKFPTLFREGINSQPNEKAFDTEKKMFESFKWGMAYVCPRGIGVTPWDKTGVDTFFTSTNKAGTENVKKTEADSSANIPKVDAKAVAAAAETYTHNLRRFYLLGQTLESQQVWDIYSSIIDLSSIDGLDDTKLWIQASRKQAANALYASLCVRGIARLDLHELPHSLMPTTKDKEGHPVSKDEPVYLNMLKYLDIPQAAAMAAERTRVVIYDDDQDAWSYPKEVGEKLGWGTDKKTGLQLRPVPKEEKP
ncbi:acetylxylan esterase [soil metagenome]